jgi:hypothetical protein
VIYFIFSAVHHSPDSIAVSEKSNKYKIIMLENTKVRSYNISNFELECSVTPPIPSCLKIL